MHNILYIGSCAKSGTHFVVEFLNRLGVQVQHEYPGRHGIVTWYIYHTPAQFPNELIIDVENSICLHQTRHPLDTISSILRLDDESWRYIRRAIGMDLSQPILYRCMEYYSRWNRALEDCSFQYKVEEIEELLDILDLFQILYNKDNISAAMQTPRLGRTQSKKPSLSWDDLYAEDYTLADNIRIMGVDYGYNCV